MRDSFAHYELISQIGAGGMGEVFLARDKKLDRKVAIKFLTTEFSNEPDRLARFEREAKAASALNHPNIITVYEVGEIEGSHYMAVEFVEGQTLRERMSSKSISFDEVLSISIQAAEALAAAHQAGIVHRDIKPENIMIRPDGYVKVLDFGLAKLSDNGTAAADAEDETKKLFKTSAGMVMGTASYMSPEQARGQEVDARTDIFSFGAMLYEILAGQVPFDGKSMIDVLAAIISADPPPLTTVAPQLPREFQRIVHKALKKDADERYQSSKELVSDLKELRDELRLEERLDQSAVPNRTQTSRASIAGVSKTGSSKDAILLTEIENKTGDPIFDQTLKAALAFSLAQSPYLEIYPDQKVSQALKMMGRASDEFVTGELGAEIAVRRGLKAYVAGSIAKFGSQFVLTLDAINAETGESLGREFEQVPTQDEVLVAISRAATGLREKLGESLASIQLDHVPEYMTTPSLDALKYYIPGHKYNSHGRGYEAIPYFQKALEIDPNFALARVILGLNYVNLGQWSKAAQEITKAYESRLAVSEAERFRLDYAYYKIVTGEIDRAIETLNLWGSRYPKILSVPMGLADSYMKIGKWEKAIDVLRKRGQLERDDVAISYVNLIESLIAMGDLREAKSVYKAAAEKDFDGYYARIARTIIAAMDDDAAELEEFLSWFAGRSEEHAGIDVQTGIAAFSGEWRKAKELSKKTIDLALKQEEGETAAGYTIDQALRIVFWSSPSGLPSSNDSQLWTVVRTLVNNALRLGRSKPTLSLGTLVFAAAGRADEAKVFTDELHREYPKDTLISGLWLPTVNGVLLLQADKPKEAIEELSVAERYERAGKFYPQYIRGLAYLQLNKANDAAREFDKILNHRGEAPLSSIYPLAQLGNARATNDKAEYEKFFEMWKDADADMPALVAARKEVETLG